ncbi:MAG: YqgE/AlgH family protein, partial [Telluria sp.]|nr:YqgE/AlgH family protein [Telluria sp.]
MKKAKISKAPPMPGLSHDDAGFVEGFASSSGTTLNLANHFLIAMPSMQDPIFGGTVVYICEHNDKGVLGVVINKPTDMTMEILFERIELKLADGLHSEVVNEPIMFGGPVQDDRGFVLHSPCARYSSSLTVTDEVAFTTSIDVLEAVANGEGPQRLLVSI